MNLNVRAKGDGSNYCFQRDKTIRQQKYINEIRSILIIQRLYIHLLALRYVYRSIANLTSILSSSGLNYYIPQSEEEFREHLRAGRYNTYLMLDLEEQHLSEELRSAVHYGDGLVYIKSRPDEEEHQINGTVLFNANGADKN